MNMLHILKYIYHFHKTFVINLGKEVYLTLEMIESTNLGLINRFDSIELLRFEMHTFTYTAVVSSSKDSWEYIVIGVNVGDGTGDECV